MSVLRGRAEVFPLPVQVPFYKGEHITFDVEPEKLDFEVTHDSVLFEVSNVASPSCYFVQSCSLAFPQWPQKTLR